MHTPFKIVCFVILLTAGSAWMAGRAMADTGPRVHVDSGAIQGKTLEVEGARVDAFLGIPFAAPPIGDLRWRPPQPVEPWEGVWSTARFAPACPQPAKLTYGFKYEDQSEDCLYLNVWTAGREGKKRPVMVWIHGGGNTIGGASAPVYDGRYFAAEGVVLVSIQYRLGVFGYLAHPALSDEAERLCGRRASGNYGLMDQIAALQWVQRNIEAFGGDPDCVTIFGESAGAANVTHLMASPLAEGLFHRAIAQSGYFGENTPHLTESRGRLARSAEQNGRAMASRFGIEGDTPATLVKLRELRAERLLEVPVSIGSIRTGGRGEPALRFGPNVDGYVLPLDPAEVWATGRMHRVPLIAGSLLDDGSVFSRGLPVRRLTGYRFVMRAIFGPDTQRALTVFPAASDAEVPGAVHRVTTIMAFRAPARRLVRWIDAAGGEAWLYHFSRCPRSTRSARQGVFHGLEIPYVFNTMSSFGDETDLLVAREMMTRWIRFARYGDPNGKGRDSASIRWPAYDATADPHLEFGDTITIGQGLDREACDLMDARGKRNRSISGSIMMHNR